MDPQEILTALQSGTISLGCAKTEFEKLKTASLLQTSKGVEANHLNGKVSKEKQHVDLLELGKNYGLIVSAVKPLNELSLQQWAVPQPNYDEVTIEVKASSINFPDSLCINGLYPTMPDYPFVPGLEVSGVITRLGSKVSEFNVGDEVIALTGRQMGGHASSVNVLITNVVRKPTHISFEEACSLPTVFLTVNYAFELGKLAPNEHVLIQTATGGCGLIAIQLAHLKGCVCFGTSSKQEKLDILERLGVRNVINYKNGSFDQRIKQITNGRGVDVVLNTLSGEAIQKGLNCLAPSGRYLELAVHGLKTSNKLDLSKLIQNQSIYSIDLRRLGLQKGLNIKDMLKSMITLLESQKLVPIVSRVYPFNQIKEALDYVSQGQHIGKVVISHSYKEMVDNTEQLIQRLIEQKKNCKTNIHARNTSMVIGNTQPQKQTNEKIAIIGMSGQFPKSPTLLDFWNNLVNGTDCVSEIPAGRWQVEDYFSEDLNARGKTNCKWMGVLEDVDKFDPLFFGISPAEAEFMDPQQRLFLENSWRCIEDSGTNPLSLFGSRCGVFAGCGAGDYKQLMQGQELSAQGLLGGTNSILAARISYLLNLKGPCLAIDTACSSSLVAIAEACNSLLLRTSDLALAGGVYVASGPSMHIMASKAGMLSKDGRCFTFDNRANGFVPGEGVGVVLLKRLSDAIRDQDPIHGVIAGWGINQDGKTNGITAPSVNSQILLEQEVLDHFNINPETISLVEAHGTGTKLGDPIEVEALTNSFQFYTNMKNYCALGSVKSNIGHLMTAAGISGVIKTLLALQHQMLPPTINFENLNEHISLENSPFYINTKLQPWEVSPGKLRRACVSSFGFSGTNAHIVIDEFLPNTTTPITVNSKNPIVFVLSAKCTEQLKAYAESMYKYVQSHEDLNLADMAYTLQVGREEMDYRLAFLADSRKALEGALDKFITNTASLEILTAQVRKGKGEVALFESDEDANVLVQTWIKKGKLRKLAELWVKGVNINWNQLYGETKPRRIHVPTIPFARERYWLPQIDTKPAGDELLSSTASAFIHPLLHQNTSTFSEQRFSTRFTGQEFFLRDHMVKGQRVLPGVAYLEMVRVAMDLAAEPFDKTRTGISLKNIVWAQPIVVGEEPVQVHIRLLPQENTEIAFEVYSQPGGVNSEAVLHSEGTAILVITTDAPVINLPVLQDLCSHRTMSQAECYQAFGTMGIDYGSGHQGIEKVFVGQGQVLAKLCLPSCISKTKDQFVLHPSLMDSAVQALIGLLMDSNNNLSATGRSSRRKPVLLYALKQLEIFSECTSSMWSFVRRSDQCDSGDRVDKFDIDLCDNQGRVCIRFNGFSTRSLEGEPHSLDVSNAVPTETYSDDLVGTIMLSPYWDNAPVNNSETLPTPSGQTVIIGGTEQNKKDILHYDPKAYVLDIKSNDSIDEIANKIAARGLIDRILWIAPCDTLESVTEDIVVKQQNEGVLLFFRTIKALLSLGYGTKDLGWTIITTQVLPINKNDLVNPTHASIHGLVGSMAKEYPDWTVRLLDLEADCPWPISDIFTLPTDPQGAPLVYRGQNWHRRQLALVRGNKPGHTLYRPQGVYVVLGGAGGIGEVWSEYMIRTYQAHIIWIGRRQKDEAIQAKMDRLAAIGPEPHYIRADATDRDALQRAYAEIKQHHLKVNGVIHSAVGLLDQSLGSMDEEHFKAGLSAKVDVSVRLAQIFNQEPLDFVLFFSSMVVFEKDYGKSSYAAGCAFKDAFASRLAHDWPCAVKVINWGYWGNVGVGGTVPQAFKNRIAQAGVGNIEPPEAMEALETLLAGDMNQIALLKTTNPEVIKEMNVELEKFTRIYPEDATSTAQIESIAAPVENVALQKPIIHGGLDVTDQMLEDYVRTSIRENIAEVLKMEEQRIQDDRSFSDYGIDSIVGVQLVNQISKQCLLSLETTVLFDYNTVDKLTRRIVTEYRSTLVTLLQSNQSSYEYIESPLPNELELKNEETEKHDNVANSFRRKGLRDRSKVRNFVHTSNNDSSTCIQEDAIAVIGMSGRFASAETVKDLWEQLVRGTDFVEEVTRWDLLKYSLKERNFCKRGSFLNDIDKFDPLFFNISGIEATYMDPQQRLFLEEAWKALEDSGYAGKGIEGSRCGVYAGCEGGDYQQLFRDDPPAQALWGNADSVIPARIAYYLDTKGPAVSVDTACSSSLVAIHLACQSLKCKETELALAGGIYLKCTPEFYLMANRAGMLSPTGHCYTFDQRADGFVPGEGVGVLVLKRLQEAIVDGDHIYGVIRGSGINQDGSTNGITAPSVNSQESLERHVYDNFHIYPEQIQMVEAHGTGTKLGDPIEYQALTQAFRHYTNKEEFCAIGSIKTNLGHTAAASGIAGVIKVLLALKHKQLPPSLHFESGNPDIQFEGSPFYVNTCLKDWAVDSGLKRCAAVSSFGISGTNAHMVIEEAPVVERKHSEKPGYLIVLSARTNEQLRKQVEQLLVYTEQECEIDCGNMSYTLLLGRKHFNKRLASVVRSKQELVMLLRKWLEKGRVPQVYVSELHKSDYREQPSLKRHGNQCINNCRNTSLASEYLEQLATIAELYVQGYSLDYEQLFSGDQYSRIPLPAYPFARERYWIPDIKMKLKESAAENSKSVSFIHPLLQQNTSDFHQTRFSSIFTGQEFFLADHIVKEQRVLPGVAYLEMAREAVFRSAGLSKQSEAMIWFRKVVWTRPIVIGKQPTQVHIGLIPKDDQEIVYKIYTGSQEGAESVLHSQGLVGLGTVTEIPVLDIAALQVECSQKIMLAREFYEAFKKIGIVCGPSEQGIEQVYVGRGKVLAKLSLPSCITDTKHQFVLHPSLMDSALQASLGLLIGSGNSLSNPAMLFALDQLDIIGHCDSILWALIQNCEGSKSESKVQKLDIDLCDHLGNVCVRIRGVSLKVLEEEIQTGKIPKEQRSVSKHKPLVGTFMLTPVWDLASMEMGQHFPGRVDKVLIVGGSEENHRKLQQYLTVNTLEVQPSINTEEIVQKLRDFSLINHIVWIVPSNPIESAMEESLIDEQSRGVLQVFRVIKALLRQGYGSRELIWSFITIQSLSIDKNDPVNPTHASIHGLIGSMAQEYPNWRVRIVDMEVGCDWPVSQIFSLPTDTQGNAWAYRRQLWYRQKLIKVQTTKVNKTLYKPRGVYVVIGGAGCIGEAWSEYMIQTYDARIVWIGRREKDYCIEAKLNRLAPMGTPPLYITADASNQSDLIRAYAEIKSQYPQINGVIHSATVMAGSSLADTAEEEFLAGLATKVNVSVRLAQVFGKEFLDFVVFFSSMSSVTKNPWECTCAPGSAFQDAFAQQMLRELPCEVKVMNWGYWGNMLGITDSKVLQTYMETQGIGFIEPSEGMTALEILLAEPVNQIVLMKTTKQTGRDGLKIADEGITVYPQSQASYIENIKSRTIPLKFKDTPKFRPPTRMETGLLDEVQFAILRTASKLLRVDVQDISIDGELSEYGFDRIKLSEFTNEVNQEFNLELASTAFYEYPNLESITAYLLKDFRDVLMTRFQAAVINA